LEIGCQTGGFTLPLLKAGFQVTAVDLVPGNLEIVRQKAEAEGLGKNLLTVLSIAEDLEAKSEFDIVMLCEVLIHCVDDVAALRHAVEAAKPGGTIITTVPYWDLYQGAEISRYYEPAGWLNLVQSIGAKRVRTHQLVLPGEEIPHTLTAVLTR
jgi:2-polyprenyl-3-methyl-5-hydroxy-6-metoxy-1,4-benzoquinol methylase